MNQDALNFEIVDSLKESIVYHNKMFKALSGLIKRDGRLELDANECFGLAWLIDYLIDGQKRELESAVAEMLERLKAMAARG